MTRKSTPLLQVSSLSAGYGRQLILKDLSFDANSGEITGLLGPNGCGKTTLLKALCRQLPHTGSCVLNGQPLERLSSRQIAGQISYIPQRSGIAVSLPVIDVVLMGFNPFLGLLEHPSPAQVQTARQALAAVGMDVWAEHDYLKLSEGQKQLCILARAIAENTPLLLLDEPESSLDFPNRHHIMRLLSSIIAGSPKAALVTLHDPQLALEYCRRLILLKDGACAGVLHPRTDSAADMESALSEIYGPIRLRAIDENGQRSLVMLPPA